MALIVVCCASRLNMGHAGPLTGGPGGTVGGSGGFTLIAAVTAAACGQRRDQDGGERESTAPH